MNKTSKYALITEKHRNPQNSGILKSKRDLYSNISIVRVNTFVSLTTKTELVINSKIIFHAEVGS